MRYVTRAQHVHSSSTMALRHTARHSDDLTCALDDLRRVANLTGGTDVLLWRGLHSVCVRPWRSCSIDSTFRTTYMRPNAVNQSRFSWTSLLGSRPIVISHFNITVSTFRNCFRRFGLRARVCRVGLPDCPAIVQNTFSSVKLCLPLSEIGCFHASSSETLHVFCVSERCL